MLYTFSLYVKKVFGIRGICISEEKLPSYTYIYLTLPLSSSHLIHSQFTKKKKTYYNQSS
ncbi:hypothetical protein Hanom_Chr15g01372001 [Helianthus anomalus]